ncbi:MAG: hypothetical protein ACOX62_04640 [Christensenellales bacterium]|jgi:hypothetical protein
MWQIAQPQAAGFPASRAVSCLQSGQTAPMPFITGWALFTRNLKYFSKNFHY